MSNETPVTANPVIVEQVNPVKEAPAAPPVEAEVPEVVTETPQEEPKDKLAPRFAALSKKEKALVEKERSIKEYESKIQAFEQAKETFKKNPVAYFESVGMQVQDVIDSILNYSPDAPPSLEDRLASTEAEINAYKRAQQEAQKQAQQAHQAQLKDEFTGMISGFVENNSTEYELIKEYNAISDVRELIEKVFTQSGGQTVMQIADAAALIEEQLLEEKRYELELARKTKKLSSLLQLTEQANGLEDRKSQEASKPKITPTLTNKTSVTAASKPSTGVSKEESIKKAASLLKWNK